jgi:hypothetical protein
MKTTKKPDQNPNATPNPKLKELTLDDLAPITGGSFEDAKNKGENGIAEPGTTLD